MIFIYNRFKLVDAVLRVQRLSKVCNFKTSIFSIHHQCIAKEKASENVEDHQCNKSYLFQYLISSCTENCEVNKSFC